MGPEDIELGDEPVEVERRSPPGVVISVRLSPDEAKKIRAIAAMRNAPISTIAREAITTYLTNGPLERPATAPWTFTTTYGTREHFGFGFPDTGCVTARTHVSRGRVRLTGRLVDLAS
jgi:hypothetical protein